MYASADHIPAARGHIAVGSAGTGLIVTADWRKHAAWRGVRGALRGMPESTRAVVLIHGIGDQQQRDTLAAFVGPFEREVKATAGETLAMRTPAAERAGEEFSYVVQETSIGGERVVAAEMYWSDLSTIKSGFLAPLVNFFDLIADAPDIVYATLGPEVRPTGVRDYTSLKLMRGMIALAFWIIYYPIVALNLGYGVLFLGFLVNARITGTAEGMAAGADWPFAIAGAVGAVVGGLVYLRSGVSYLRNIAIWTAGLLAIVASVSVTSLALAQGGFKFGDWTAFMDRCLMTVWLIPFFIGAIYFAALPFLFCASVSAGAACCWATPRPISSRGSGCC